MSVFIYIKHSYRTLLRINIYKHIHFTYVEMRKKLITSKFYKLSHINVFLL